MGQVSGGVIARGAAAVLRVNRGGDCVTQRDAPLHDAALVHDQPGDGRVGAGHVHAAAGGGEHSGVAHLPPALRIEGALPKRKLHLVSRLRAGHRPRAPQNPHNDGLLLQPVVPQETGGLHPQVPVLVDARLLLAFESLAAGAGDLLMGCFLLPKLFPVDPLKPLFLRHSLGLLRGEAVGCGEVEGDLARDKLPGPLHVLLGTVQSKLDDVQELGRGLDTDAGEGFGEGRRVHGQLEAQVTLVVLEQVEAVDEDVMHKLRPRELGFRHLRVAPHEPLLRPQEERRLVHAEHVVLLGDRNR